MNNAELHGSGAIAQGDGAQAAGERGVVASGNIDTVNTGTQIVNHYHAASDQRLSKEQIAQQVTGYLRWLQARTENIELRGIERAGGAPVVLLPLETAYVPLRAKWMGWGGADIALNQVLGLGNRLVIIGGPGSGKTTVLMHMAWALASSLLSGQSDPARSRLGPLMKPDEQGKQDEQGRRDKQSKPEECKPNELPLPIFVPLASFARYRRNLAGQRTGAREDPGPLHLAPPDQQAGRFRSARRLLRATAQGRPGRAPAAGRAGRSGQRGRARRGAPVGGGPGGRARGHARRGHLPHHRLPQRAHGAGRAISARSPCSRSTSTQHIAPMVRQAYACIYPHDAALRAERADDLLDGIQRLEAERRARLGEQAEALVDSPLMVRLLLIVHVNNRKLPDERADLFDKAINALLQVDYGREEQRHPRTVDGLEAVSRHGAASRLPHAPAGPRPGPRDRGAGPESGPAPGRPNSNRASTISSATPASAAAYWKSATAPIASSIWPFRNSWSRATCAR